ncbi:ATP-binding protein [Gordonia polyisoprenivorans]|uniref:ATP-binding protein n=1 Tax=Gordonia polyisoprenivorans TaxID=84595 RepID=UPI002FDDC1C8
MADLIAQARDFRVLTADGVQNDRAPYALLTQWGVEPGRMFDGGQSTPRVAAQGLRDRLDALAAAGPVLLVADDLQWADPESVDALLWLLRRTAGDRLLVAVGTRPPAPGQHPDWKRWIEGPGAAVTITLTGLTRGQVAEMARRRWPSISDELVGRLHETPAATRCI